MVLALLLIVSDVTAGFVAIATDRWMHRKRVARVQAARIDPRYPDWDTPQQTVDRLRALIIKEMGPYAEHRPWNAKQAAGVVEMFECNLAMTVLDDMRAER